MGEPWQGPEVYAADRNISLICAGAYMRAEFPGVQLEWGDTKALPEPDDIDGIWRQPAGEADGRDRWIAVTTISRTYGPAERAYSWGGRVLAGTRDYLWFASHRLREHGQDRLADALETEMLASRLIYLELTTTGETRETLEVQARQYDISDDTLVAKMLAAIHDHDWRRIEHLREPLGAGAADMLAAAYWTLPGWVEKALLAQVAREVRDRSHAGLRAVFDDLLDIPDAGHRLLSGDLPREVRTIALTWLDDDLENFVRLYEDSEAQAAGIARHRRSRR